MPIFIISWKKLLKIQRTALSKGFLNQWVYCKFASTFAKVKGSLATITDKKQVEKKILKRQLTDHDNNLQCLRINHELWGNLLQ